MIIPHPNYLSCDKHSTVMIISNKFSRLSLRIPYFSLQVLERCQQNLCDPSKRLYSKNNIGLVKNDASTDGKVVQKPLPSKLQSSLYQSSQHPILLSRLAKNRMNHSSIVSGDKNNSDKKQTKVARNSFPRIKYSSPWTKKINCSLPQSHSGSRLRPSKAVKEHGVVIAVSENSPISNDGTSSGALAADRLRLARRKILQSMASKDQVPKISSLDFSSQKDKPGATHRSKNQTGGMFVVPYENPPRSSDGTSSGAITADRLRLARRKMLERMTSSNDQITQAQPVDNTPNNDNPDVTTNKKDRTGGMSVVPYENPPKSSDGTSSGAIAADRLRLARRKMLESMTFSEDQNHNSKN